MLSITELTGGYGGRPVLHDLTLHVDPGETVALLGVNTAGKTSLIRALCGILPDCRGTVRLGEQDLSQSAPFDRVAAGLACVPEGRHVFPRMSVEENLMLGAYHRRTEDLTEDMEQCFTLFERLRERRRQMAGTLSGGEQQMVAVCRALMAKPRLLLMDEPSHGLAPLMVEEVHGAIAKVNAAGIGVLLVEQNLKSALRIASRGYVISSGRIVMEGTAEELSTNQDVKRSYLGM
ncbi:ABC transporter ATP-binding protein [Pseudooceanicola sp. C21-150M6]|uniref:ABC transporter ATP-binding protein n=1 Tax=Pseudooceanicola sp. C21-150M6 TaxID=3434355 RepID=UPI003D7FA70F